MEKGELSLNKLKKALKYAMGVLLSVILFINISTILLGCLGLKEHLKWMPVAFLQVTSNSMSPMFSQGDVLLVVETPYEKLEIGDVVTFHRGEEFITHQIVSTYKNEYITKGIDNTKEDDPIGPKEYCARMICVFPSMGGVLNFMTTPVRMIFLGLFLFVLFYGYPVIKEGIKTDESEEILAKRMLEAIRGKSRVRVMTLAATLSFIVVTPFMTAAKYTAVINEYTMISAASINFTSNYLSEDKNSYFINGWNGNTYYFNLQIKGYNNDLLYNNSNQDLYYGLYIKPITISEEGQKIIAYKTYGEDYTVRIIPKNNLTPILDSGVYEFSVDGNADVSRIGPFYLEGSDEAKVEHEFQVEVVPENGKILANDSIRFEIIAATSEQNQFFVELSGDFQFKMAESNSFFGESYLGVSGTLVTRTLKTNLIDDGSATKYVRFSWDPEKLYINEFESTAYNIIINQTQSNKSFSKDEGYIIVPMQAFSKVALQFFKINASSEITVEDITFEIIANAT